MISFVPEGRQGIGANGTIQNGYYAMSTAGDRDGVKAGRFKVTITSIEDTYAKDQEDFKKTTKQEEDGLVPARFLSKAAASAKGFCRSDTGTFARQLW